jgi:hypothetical protein
LAQTAVTSLKSVSRAVCGAERIIEANMEQITAQNSCEPDRTKESDVHLRVGFDAKPVDDVPSMWEPGHRLGMS